MRQGEDFRWLRVAGSQRISPSMQRLRLVGRDLQHFSSPENLHVRLHIPSKQRHWNEQSAKEAGEKDGAFIMRYYTIRSIDADAGWMDIDFVVHAQTGPGCDFSLTAQFGEICGVSGPCGRGLRPCSSCLLIGDETALPAISRICETLAPDCVGRILLQSSQPARISAPENVTIKWICPSSSPDQDIRRITDEAKRVLNAPSMRSAFIWGAGESQLAEHLRRITKHVPKDRSLIVPYWRRRPTVGQE